MRVCRTWPGRAAQSHMPAASNARRLAARARARKAHGVCVTGYSAGAPCAGNRLPMSVAVVRRHAPAPPEAHRLRRMVIKSGKGTDGRRVNRRPENISITNCTVHHAHGAVVLGSETSGGIRNLVASNIACDGTQKHRRDPSYTHLQSCNHW